MKDIDIHTVTGTLLEAAIRDQKAIEEAVKGLGDARGAILGAASTLPSAVSREVNVSLKIAINDAADVLVHRFEAANISAERAATAYEKAAAFVIWKVAGMGLGVTAIGALAIVGMAWIAMPNLAEIQALRAERDKLQQDLALLVQRGAKSDTSACELPNNPKKTRFCVKLDPRFEDRWGGYRIVADK